jgi:ABC-2 type transport system ATP-binding protein
MISVKSVTKFYGEQKVLDNVSFEIGKGEIVGFLGPNGAGKSTMMKILTGYLSASSGEVQVAGVTVSPHHIKPRHKIGYLPENNPLYPDMYVREYLMFAAGLYNISNPKERIETLIEATGLQNECHKLIGELSKGYRQRVGLAQALMADPDVLILDEPTTGLDPNQIADVRKLILSLGESKTILLSTHIMQEVQAICRRAIIIHQGAIVADNSVSELNKNKGMVSVIDVEFEGEADIEAMRLLENCVLVEPMQKGFRIEATSDIRPALSKLAVEKGWIILTMNLHKSSLEEVFHALTR